MSSMPAHVLPQLAWPTVHVEVVASSGVLAMDCRVWLTELAGHTCMHLRSLLAQSAACLYVFVLPLTCPTSANTSSFPFRLHAWQLLDGREQYESRMSLLELKCQHVLSHCKASVLLAPPLFLACP